MNIKEFYLNAYPTDDMGEDINENANFTGLITQIFGGFDIYEYLGVYDSLVRERLFLELANQLNKPYEFVYRLWLDNEDDKF